MSGKAMIVLISLALLVGIAADSVYFVDEREYAVVLQFGQIKDTDAAPGPHLKFPLIQNVRYFDNRILSLDKQPERFLTREKKNVKVDFFVKWRIKDIGRYYRATGGDEAIALDRLSDIINRGLRNQFGTRTIKEAVSGERSEIVRELQATATEKVNELGIELFDVRVKRIDLPDVVSDSVYERMRAERQRVASELRAKGGEAGERIRAEADREREVILATAYRKAQEARGVGDGKATEIYAKAYGKNEEFFRFYRSLEVYRRAFSGRDDVLVLDPDGDLFKYFKSAKP